MLLKDKIAVISGGAGINGLGFATARQMAAHGARVVILDLARAEPAGAAARLGDDHLGLVADVTDKAACVAAIERTLKAFGKIDQLLATVGEDRVTVRIRLHSQPWHMFSPVLIRTILAAAATGGKEAARAVMAAVYARIPEFEFERHATGPNRDATPNDLIRRIEGHTGLELMAAFNDVELDKGTRWETRYARQNGIHVSPSFMIDGIVQPEMSSGDAVADWVRGLA